MTGSLAAISLAGATANAATTTTFYVSTGGTVGAADTSCATAGYSTIQSAVDAAAAGNTVSVCAGNYTGAVTIPSALVGLTLEGAQQGVDARTRSVPAAQESVVEGAGASGQGISIQADNVTVNGFTVQDFSGFGLDAASSVSGAKVIDNIVTSNVAGMYLNSDGTSQDLVQHNLFASNQAPGSASGDGIYSDAGVSNVSIDANLFTGIGAMSAGIVLVQGAPSTQTNISITGNQFTGTSTQGGTAMVFGDVSQSTIADNVVNGTGPASDQNDGIDFLGNDSNMTLTGNVFRNAGGWAVQFLDAFGPSSTVPLADNDLDTSNALGGLNVTTGSYAAASTVTATSNWWGSPSGPGPVGPGTGSAVSSGADFANWCVTVTCAPGAYTPLTPTRICDTRVGNPSGLTGAATQCDGKTLTAGGTLNVADAGSFGVPADAAAVIVNVTAINAAGTGYVSVSPTGSSATSTSTLNVTPGKVVANLTEVGVGPGGQITVFASTGVDVALDVEGYVTGIAAGGAGAGLYVPLHPTRVCDTRPGNPSNLAGAAKQCGSQTLAAGTARQVAVGGLFGVPAGATAVVANVTAVDPTGTGFVTVYPDGSTRPTASNLNYTAGTVVPGRVTVALGSNGDLDVYSSQGTDILVDISGYYTAAGGTGAGFTAAPTQTRICDTRPGNPSNLTGDAAQCNNMPLGRAGTLPVNVAGKFGVPAGAVAATLNVTAIAPTATTFLSVRPDSSGSATSDLNASPGQVKANLVVATLSPTGTVTVYNNSGTTNMAIDLTGWYSPIPNPPLIPNPA